MKTKVESVNTLLLAGEPGNVTTDEHAGYTGYRPQAIIDAMNEVFFGEWGFSEVGSEIVPGDKGSLAVAQVQVWLAGIEFKPTSWGQNRVTRGDIGDARKGAQTDAIKKALSYFSIGNRAYQGLLKEDSQGHSQQNGNKRQVPQSAPKPRVENTQVPEPRNPVDQLKREALEAKFITGNNKDELAKAWRDRLRAVFQRDITDDDLLESEALRATLRAAIERYVKRNAEAATSGKLGV